MEQETTNLSECLCLHDIQREGGDASAKQSSAPSWLGRASVCCSPRQHPHPARRAGVWWRREGTPTGTPGAPSCLPHCALRFLCKSKKWMNSTVVCSFPKNQKAVRKNAPDKQLWVFDHDHFCISPGKASTLLFPPRLLPGSPAREGGAAQGPF